MKSICIFALLYCMDLCRAFKTIHISSSIKQFHSNPLQKQLSCFASIPQASKPCRSPSLQQPRRSLTAVDTLRKLEYQRGTYTTSAFNGATQAQVNAKNAILESEINDAYERLRRVKAQYNRQFPDNPWAPYDASPPANPTKEII